MIRTTLYITKYDWLVHCYFAVTCFYAHEIIAKMAYLGASGKNLADAWASMNDGKLNGGITYTNPVMRESVMVTELTDDVSEFMDSLVHETGHLATHIAVEEGLSLEGEEVRYIQGDMTKALYPSYRSLLREKCRAKR